MTTVTPNDLNQTALIVYLKMQIAVWADDYRRKTLADAGLFTAGCPLCGKRDVCPSCGRCEDHHDTVLDMFGEREVTAFAISSFFSAFCRADTPAVMESMKALAEPEDVIASYREPCEFAGPGLDSDVWGSAFASLFDDE